MAWIIGAIVGASSFKILGGMASGPAALWGLRLVSSLRTPFWVMFISGMIGYFAFGASGCLRFWSLTDESCFKVSGLSLVKTDSNC